MGILNITPDSFYDGGFYYDKDTAVSRVNKLVDEGADMVDFGAYSSRPGADHIPAREEWERLYPVLDIVRERYPDLIISVDTFRSEIAGRAVNDYDVDIINDISGGELDTNMHSTLAELNVPYIMMHMKGTPQNMKEKAHYEDLIREVSAYFSSKVEGLRKLGVKDIILDPGFGFAKNIDQNFSLLKNLRDFSIFGLPLIVGLSRKSMIYKTLDIEPSESLPGTIAVNTLALLNGADILRVHDVKEAKQVIAMVENYNDAEWFE
jgi:dihydropteroate synthase